MTTPYAAAIAALPALNGVAEVGIAAGADASLAEPDRLRVGPATASAADRYTIVCTDALHIACARGWTSPQAQAFVIGCANVCQRVGLLCADDGDIALDDARTGGTLDPATLALLTDEFYSRCLSVVIATKISWWTCNHHTGGPTLVGYPHKVWEALFGQDAHWKTAAARDVTAMVHLVGHWASTRFALAAIEMAGMRLQDGATRAAGDLLAVRSLGPADAPTLSPSGDVLIRCTAAPAGTHRHAVAQAATKLVLRSQLRALFPGATDLLAVCAVDLMDDAPTRHQGCGYLTGLTRTFDDHAADAVLGRLGTYVTTIMPKSTLAKSPHYHKEAIKGYPDYQDGWATICRAFADMSAAVPKAERTVMAVRGSESVGVNTYADISALCHAAGVAAPPELDYNTLRAAAQEAAYALDIDGVHFSYVQLEALSAAKTNAAYSAVFKGIATGQGFVGDLKILDGKLQLERSMTCAFETV